MKKMCYNTHSMSVCNDRASELKLIFVISLSFFINFFTCKFQGGLALDICAVGSRDFTNL